MQDDLRSIREELLALHAITAALWSNVLSNGVSDPTATARRLSHEMRAEFEQGLERAQGESDLHLSVTLRSVQNHVESFWTSVEQLLERRERESR